VMDGKHLLRTQHTKSHAPTHPHKPPTPPPPISHTGLRALLLLSTAIAIGVAVGLGTARLFVRLALKDDPLRQVCVCV
jgi:hypothetical protein